MWIARDKDNRLTLFVYPPKRSKDYGGTWEEVEEYDLDSGYCDLNPSLFPNLKWEDEPVEVVIHERFPVNEITCLDCGTTFKYTAKDVESSTYENPWNAGEFEHEDCVKCPDCGKYVIISHY